MATINASRTAANLQFAFAADTLASQRYLALAQRAEAKGRDRKAALCRPIADRRSNHALNHLETLETSANPSKTRKSVDTIANVRAVLAGKLHEHANHCPSKAHLPYYGRLHEIDGWLKILQKAGNSDSSRLRDTRTTAMHWYFPCVLLAASQRHPASRCGPEICPGRPQRLGLTG